MTPEELQEKKILFRKAKAAYRNFGRVTECFYHDKSQCKGDIKQSHSLQRNGRLSLIEGDVNGNKMIYTFTEAEIDEHTTHSRLIPIGKATASTFFGFCDHHDTALFSPIETHPFDGSDKHCFLHSYRSFAHSYHRKKEEYKAQTTNSDYSKLIPKAFLDNLKYTTEISLKEGEEEKKRIDNLFQNSEFNGLDYLIHELPESFPIACSSQIMPPYSYKNVLMNNHSNPNIPYRSLMLTVLPDHDKTIIILACFPDDEKGNILIDELEKLYPIAFQKAISSLLITCAENTFFAPALWDALGTKGQKQLCSELRNSADIFYNPGYFEHSQINFFDYKFSRKKLKL